MDSQEAKAFFLTHQSYCNLDLPQYFDFTPLLNSIDKKITGKNLKSYYKVLANEKKCLLPEDYEDVCYTILHNKDGKFAWRPIKLIHPVIYVDLVNKITEYDNWKTIKDQFISFSSNPKIHCTSIPVESNTINSNKAEQILHWWEEVEQKSIELSLDFDFLYRTDITDCYSQIYTHSISWALHTKSISKSNKQEPKLIGNYIDASFRSMQSGQTNGIPQGSILSDFIAEMVLGYADTEISKLIYDDEIKSGYNNYYILRYRDDYRIFVNNPLYGEKILQIISQVLFDLGLKMNPYKTDSTSNIVKDAVKADKVNWNAKKQSEMDFQKHLLLIHDFSQNFPNSGSLAKGLEKFFNRIVKRNSLGSNILPMIGIVADIAVNNPRHTPICTAILSKFFEMIPSDITRHQILMRLLRKLRKAPNNGHLEIWIQRISLFIENNGINFNEKLCQIAAGDPVIIWNSDWLSPNLKKLVDKSAIVDSSVIKSMKIKIETSEVLLFNWIHES